MTLPTKCPKKPLLFFNEEKLNSKKVLYASELQKLIGLILFPQHYSAWPDWCVVRKPVLIRSLLLLFCDHPDGFSSENSALKDMFGKPIQFYSPEAYNYSWDAEIRQVPRLHLSKHAMRMVDFQQPVNQPAPKRVWIPNDGNQTVAKKLRATEIAKKICSTEITHEPNSPSLPHRNEIDVDNGTPNRPTPFPMPEPGAPDAFDRTQLLMNLDQMIRERIPLPPELRRQSKASDSDGAYVPSKPFYHPVSASSPMYAIDCEMVVTKVGTELARVTMVDELNCIVFDRLVRPDNPVEDYVTRFSGITRAMLAPVTTRVVDIQRELSELLPADAILVGHSIGNDLHAMQIYHPYLIDTSVIYNLKGARSSKARLRFLSEHFLGRMIQTGRAGHSSAEDAIATMDLARLKLSQSLAFGDVTTAWRFPENYNEARFKNQSQSRIRRNTQRNSITSSNVSEGTPLAKLSSSSVPPFFQLKVADLQTSYNVFGPPVDLADRLLKDASIPYTLWPVCESEPSAVGSNLSEEHLDVGTNDVAGQASCSERNLVSKNLVTWLAGLTQTNRFIMARVHCACDEWDAPKRERKFTRFGQRLYRAVPEHTLLVLVCAGPAMDSDTKPSLSPREAKRTVYITLTKSLLEHADGGTKAESSVDVLPCTA